MQRKASTRTHFHHKDRKCMADDNVKIKQASFEAKINSK